MKSIKEGEGVGDVTSGTTGQHYRCTVARVSIITEVVSTTTDEPVTGRVVGDELGSTVLGKVGEGHFPMLEFNPD